MCGIGSVTLLRYLLLLCFGCLWMRHNAAASAACGGILTNATGSFWTPNYPNKYPSGIECIWLIQTDISKYIEVTIEDFDVEPFRDCKTDKLEIKDGGNKYSPMIGMTSQQFHDGVEGGQYCNTSPPPRIVTSSANFLRFWFHADSRDNFRGFFISYRTIKEHACGGMLPSTNAVIHSPRYPLSYPSNTACSWLIKSPPGKYIHLQFLDFQMEFVCKADGTCQCADWVQIQDGDRVIGSYCFSSPSTFVSSSNELRLKFWSGPIGRSRGFKAIVSTSSTAACGGDFLAKNGTFITPNFAPLAHTTYPAFSDCVWTITAPKDHYISLHFTFLDVVSIDKSFCIGDYVEVRDGPDSMASLVGMFCNSNSPQVLLSTKMSLYIKFHSDGRDHGKGFKANFKTHRKTCGESLGFEDGRLKDGLLTASSFLRVSNPPQSFAPSNGRLNGRHAWCSQEQRFFSSGEYFQVQFLHMTKVSAVVTQGFLLPFPYNHSQYVTKYRLRYSVGDGLWRDFKAVKNFDDDLPFTVFNGGRDWQDVHLNQLDPPVVASMVRLYPLDYVSGQRKHICIRAEMYGCPLELGGGLVLSGSQGGFAFNSSSSQPATINQWVIMPPSRTPHTFYRLNFDEFDVDCAGGKLTVSRDPMGKDKTEYCGTQRPPPDIYSAYLPTWIEFRTMSLHRRPQSFSFRYSAEDIGMGSVLRSPSGVINASLSSLSSGRSIWFIILTPGERVDVRCDVLTIAAKPGGGCADFVEFKDGLADNSPSLGRFCGGLAPAHPLVSTRNHLRVEFVTDSKYTLQNPPANADEKHGVSLTYVTWRRKPTTTTTTTTGTTAPSSEAIVQARLANSLDSGSARCDSAFERYIVTFLALVVASVKTFAC